MTGKLKPPRSEEPTDERTTEPRTDVFPYEGERTGTPIPSRTAVGVLPSSDGVISVPDESTCPSCGGETVNGMGLFACTDCEWVGRLE